MFASRDRYDFFSLSLAQVLPQDYLLSFGFTLRALLNKALARSLAGQRSDNSASLGKAWPSSARAMGMPEWATQSRPCALPPPLLWHNNVVATNWTDNWPARVALIGCRHVRCVRLEICPPIVSDRLRAAASGGSSRSRAAGELLRASKSLFVCLYFSLARSLTWLRSAKSRPLKAERVAVHLSGRKMITICLLALRSSRSRRRRRRVPARPSSCPPSKRCLLPNPFRFFLFSPASECRQQLAANKGDAGGGAV